MQQGPEQSRRLALGLLFLLVFIWGANWPLMKMALADLPPYWFAVSRFALGSAVLFALLAAKGRLGLPNRRDLPVILTVAWLQMAAFMSLVNTGLLFVDAGRSAILAYTTPLWVTPLSLLWLKEPMTRNKVIGLVLGLGGVLVLFNPGALDWQDPDVVRGNGLLLLAAFCWALAILHVRGHKWQGTPFEIAPWQMLFALVPLTALALWKEEIGPVEWDGELTALVLYNGVLATAFGFWASVMIARHLPAVTSSLGFLAVPVSGVFFSALLLGETLTLSLLFGMVLIVGGVGFVSLPQKGRNKKGEKSTQSPSGKASKACKEGSTPP